MNRNRKKITTELVNKTAWLIGIASGVLLMNEASAADGGGIGEVANTITDSIAGLANLITSGAYIAGLFLAVGAILKFKQHRDNPTQIPIGTPIAMLGVAAALLYLPSLLSTAGETVFGSGAEANSIEGFSSTSGDE